ncbi:MAG: hypothetical protein JW801_14450 [Bacteroidales bacterium]|nr:hypothetical protein [Bacteroidales bacterium]
MKHSERKYRLNLLLITGILLLPIQCEKIEPKRVVYVETEGVSSISYTSSTVSGNLLDAGEKGVSQHGHCWGTSENPSREQGSKTSLGEKKTTGTFESHLEGLTPGTTYFVRAYAISAEGVLYGENKSFSTVAAGIPEIATQEVTEITRSEAVCGGEITADGGYPVTDRGICWNTNGQPSLEDHITHEGSGTGSFSSVMTGLSDLTKYYVRAYASNAIGTQFGEVIEFTTNTYAAVVSETSAINPTSLMCGGTVTSDGGAEVTERGVCWSTSSYPEYDDNHLHAESVGTGTYSLTITGLEPATRYYIRAYVFNINGIAYGEILEFITQMEDSRDGKIYPVVFIGDQCWMAKNLNVGTQINISVGQSDNSVIEKYCYDNDYSNCDLFGGLYTWPEMMQYTETESVQGVCPDGWHLPSDQEWKTMEEALGMSSNTLDLFDWRGTDQGAQLKATGTSIWTSPNNATNSSGFSALPGGYSIEDSDAFGGINDYTTFWTSTIVDVNTIIYRLLDHEEIAVLRTTGYAPNGTPVRCIKD